MTAIGPLPAPSAQPSANFGAPDLMTLVKSAGASQVSSLIVNTGIVATLGGQSSPLPGLDAPSGGLAAAGFLYQLANSGNAKLIQAYQGAVGQHLNAKA